MSESSLFKPGNVDQVSCSVNGLQLSDQGYWQEGLIGMVWIPGVSERAGIAAAHKFMEGDGGVLTPGSMERLMLSLRSAPNLDRALGGLNQELIIRGSSLSFEFGTVRVMERNPADPFGNVLDVDYPALIVNRDNKIVGRLQFPSLEEILKSLREGRQNPNPFFRP